MSHRPEPSGRVVRGEVDGLDSGGRHGGRFVLRRTKAAEEAIPICTGRSGNDVEAVEPDPAGWQLLKTHKGSLRLVGNNRRCPRCRQSIPKNIGIRRAAGWISTMTSWNEIS